MEKKSDQQIGQVLDSLFDKEQEAPGVAFLGDVERKPPQADEGLEKKRLLDKQEVDEVGSLEGDEVSGGGVSEEGESAQDVVTKDVGEVERNPEAAFLREIFKDIKPPTTPFPKGEREREGSRERVVRGPLVGAPAKVVGSIAPRSGGPSSARSLFSRSEVDGVLVYPFHPDAKEGDEGERIISAKRTDSGEFKEAQELSQLRNTVFVSEGAIEKEVQRLVQESLDSLPAVSEPSEEEVDSSEFTEFGEEKGGELGDVVEEGETKGSVEEVVLEEGVTGASGVPAVPLPATAFDDAMASFLASELSVLSKNLSESSAALEGTSGDEPGDEHKKAVSTRPSVAVISSQALAEMPGLHAQQALPTNTTSPLLPMIRGSAKLVPKDLNKNLSKPDELTNPLLRSVSAQEVVRLGLSADVAMGKKEEVGEGSELPLEGSDLPLEMSDLPLEEEVEEHPWTGSGLFASVGEESREYSLGVSEKRVTVESPIREERSSHGGVAENSPVSSAYASYPLVEGAGQTPVPSTGGYSGQTPVPSTGGYSGQTPVPSTGGYSGQTPVPSTGVGSVPFVGGYSSQGSGSPVGGLIPQASASGMEGLVSKSSSVGGGQMGTSGNFVQSDFLSSGGQYVQEGHGPASGHFSPVGGSSGAHPSAYGQHLTGSFAVGSQPHLQQYHSQAGAFQVGIQGLVPQNPLQHPQNPGDLGAQGVLPQGGAASGVYQTGMFQVPNVYQTGMYTLGGVPGQTQTGVYQLVPQGGQAVFQGGHPTPPPQGAYGGGWGEGDPDVWRKWQSRMPLLLMGMGVFLLLLTGLVWVGWIYEPWGAQMRGGQRRGLFGSDVAKVRISSSPRGAQIFIDDVGSGKKTPMTFRLAPGTYTLELRRQGYLSRTKRLTLKSRQELFFDFDLTERAPAPRPRKREVDATLFVSSSPSQAKIWLDGQKQEGRTPSLLRLTAGKHILELKRRGYKVFKQIFEIESKQQRHLQFSLQKKRRKRWKRRKRRTSRSRRRKTVLPPNIRIEKLP